MRGEGGLPRGDEDGARPSPLLLAKLRPPQLPEHAVPRPRLVELLDELAAAPLTLVVAPAGSGKSVLLASWIAQRPEPSAWLALDESDRDPVQFWTSVLSTVQALVPGSTDAALALLRSKRSMRDVVLRLLNDLDGAVGAARHLVLDDLHLVDGRPDLSASIDLFLEHLPTGLHVLIGSRRDPHLPVDRLRARGLLGEVRFAELRFSPDEATALLSGLAPSMPPARVAETVAATAGWAAGLQMAALAERSSRARGDEEDSGAGRDVLVDDFVWHEVLAREPAELVQLLLDVSVAERVNGALASALSERPDAGELLARAAARGLFVGRLGADGWFEVHGLVRAALLGELDRRAPARRHELHARAARWFEEHDEVPAALDHWLLARSPRQALRLLAREHGRLYDQGREAIVQRVIDAIPPDVTTADLEATLEYAWCHLLVSRRGLIDTVDHASWCSARTEVDAALGHRLTMLEALVSVVRADWVDAARRAKQALAGMGDRWRDDQVGRYGWNVVVRDVALSERWDEAAPEVAEAERALQPLPERRLALEGTRALGLVLAGRPVDALQVIAGLRQATDVTTMTILRTELAVAEAIAHRELGDRPRALAELQEVAEAPAETMVYCTLLALVELVGAHCDVADLAEAREAFRAAESLVVMESLGPGGRDWLARAGTDLARAAGDRGEAQHWAQQIDDPFWRSISAARLHLDAGDRPSAEEAVLGAEPRCARHEVILDLVRARTADDPHQAAKLVARALELASDHHQIQTVASDGRALVEVLEREAGAVPAEWMDRLRRVMVDGEHGRLAPLGLVEPLTEREREVLRYLPSRLTTREIADELYVSVNTLKFHLKVIYRKLGVTSRAEAVERARQLSAG